MFYLIYKFGLIRERTRESRIFSWTSPISPIGLPGWVDLPVRPHKVYRFWRLNYKEINRTQQSEKTARNCILSKFFDLQWLLFHLRATKIRVFVVAVASLTYLFTYLLFTVAYSQLSHCMPSLSPLQSDRSELSKRLNTASLTLHRSSGSNDNIINNNNNCHRF